MDKKIHILFVDDDEVTRRLFGHVLAAAGFEVIYAEDGNIGREMARRFQPDLILMDINIPVIDGIKAVNMLRMESQTKHIPIILFTNSDLSIEAESAVKQLGATEYVSKSIEPKKLIDIINATLTKYTLKSSDSKLK